MPPVDGYLVQCSDGPARGWEYWVGIPPNETILIQANPFPDSPMKWLRMPDGTKDIEGTPPLLKYVRDPLPAYTQLDVTGALIVVYSQAADDET